MIIELLLDGIYTVFSLLMSPINIPDLPDTVIENIQYYLEYLAVGKAILSAYTPIDYMLLLVGIAFAIEIGIMAYHLVMWVLKKIPMLGIE